MERCCSAATTEELEYAYCADCVQQSSGNEGGGLVVGKMGGFFLYVVMVIRAGWVRMVMDGGRSTRVRFNEGEWNLDSVSVELIMLDMG